MYIYKLSDFDIELLDLAYEQLKLIIKCIIWFISL